jgi:hypothetical protein
MSFISEVSTKSLIQSNSPLIIEDLAKAVSETVIGLTFSDVIDLMQPSIDEEDLRINLEQCGIYYG